MYRTVHIMPQPIIAAHQVTQTIQINQNQFTI
ncbi:ABC transporter ATP-binding protein, partial [Acinetobacter baumannii]